MPLSGEGVGCLEDGGGAWGDTVGTPLVERGADEQRSGARDD